MNIEKDIFKKSHVNFEKLITYGFQKINNRYCYSKDFLNGDFKADIIIDENGIVTGKVIDLETNEEYSNIRVSSQIGAFVNKVREEYKNILMNIKNNCFDDDFFMSKQANIITEYINNTYHDKPEFLWDKFKNYGVFRNKGNNKWYAIIMNINKSKIEHNSNEEIEILNIKLDNSKIEKLLKRKGFYKAYHMNKKGWITITLDNTLKDKEIIDLLTESYHNTNESTNWIVPANPKYYDIVNCFCDKNEIIWKQSSEIHINDIVYIYVSAPYSKIMYKCIATEVNIPYEYKDQNISMTHVMKLKLINNLINKEYTFEYLNKQGIKSIRGPRKIEDYLVKKLK